MIDLSKSFEFFDSSKYKDKIHIIGCGSVGSTVATMLARSGVTNFVLYDFDIVEGHNIVNQMFRLADVGRNKAEALLDLMCEINPDIAQSSTVFNEGWHGERLSGFVFMCVDSMKTRQEIAKSNMANHSVKAMFDFRTRLEDAQHYAADWSDYKQKKNFIASMAFSDEAAEEVSPVSACGVTLGVFPTVATVCAHGVANFMNFWNGRGLKNMILDDIYHFTADAM